MTSIYRCYSNKPEPPLPIGHLHGIDFFNAVDEVTKAIIEYRKSKYWAWGYNQPKKYKGVLWYPLALQDNASVYSWNEYVNNRNADSTAYCDLVYDIARDTGLKRNEGLMLMGYQRHYEASNKIYLLKKYNIGLNLVTGQFSPPWLRHQLHHIEDINKVVAGWRQGVRGPLVFWDWAPFTHLVGPYTPVSWKGYLEIWRLKEKPEFVFWNDVCGTNRAQDRWWEYSISRWEPRPLQNFWNITSEVWKQLPAMGLVGASVPHSWIKALFKPYTYNLQKLLMEGLADSEGTQQEWITSQIVDWINPFFDWCNT